MIWSDDTITRFASEGEKEASVLVKCINKRVALNIRSQRSLYNVPDDCATIRRVTWKGKKLEPKHFRGLLQYPVVNPANNSVGAYDVSGYENLGFFTGGSNSTPQSGTPYVYFYSGFGENVIKIFPTPNINLPPDFTDLYGSSIPNCCIVEYYAFADPSGSTYRLPAFIRRRLVKAFTCFKCFSQEGIGQDLVSSGIYKALFDETIEELKTINSDIFIAKMRVRSPNANVFATKISRPRLPTNFGYRDDDI